MVVIGALIPSTMRARADGPDLGKAILHPFSPLPQFCTGLSLAVAATTTTTTIGGVRPKILDFLCLDVCYSPSYLVSKMGSLSSQLRTVAEIRRDKVGHYAHFFRKMYGKFGKKIKKKSLKIAKTQH